MAKAQQEARQERSRHMTSAALPAFDLDPVVVRAIGRLPLIESVADERTVGLTVGTDGWAGKDPCLTMRDVALDVGAEVYYNGHVVEPAAKNPPPSRVFAAGFSFRSLMGSEHTGLPLLHQSSRRVSHPTLLSHHRTCGSASGGST
jgi:hypothetical protein